LQNNYSLNHKTIVLLISSCKKTNYFQAFDLSAEQAGKKTSKTSLPAGKGRAFEVLKIKESASG